MEEILQKVHELGSAIQGSDIFKTYQKTEVIFQTNEEAQSLTKEYNAKREELMKKAQKEDVSAEEMMQIRNEMNAAYGKVAANDVIAAYLNAKKDMEEVLGTVDGIIRFYVTGEEPGGCGGNCSGCAGCH